jgi:hypothetical protein
MRGGVALGVMQLALLRRQGIEQFQGTAKAFLNSLAPLIAFPLAGGVLGVLSGDGLDAVAGFLGTVVALLAPPVLSDLLARFWGREREWLRYATAFNWSRWAMLLALGVALMLMGTLASAGIGRRAAVVAGLVAVAGYGAVLDWFVARVGLRLAGWQAVVLVVVVNAGTAALFLAPRLLWGFEEGAQS